MRSKILTGTIIFGLLAVIALGIVAASPNSQAATPTPTATPTPSEKAYQLTVDAIKELASLNSTSDGLIFSAVTDVVIEIMAGTRNQTPQELKAQILGGLSNPTASETLKETLRVTDPDATLVTALLNNIVINIIADKTGETAAQVRARLSTPATPTPTPTPTGSATATPSPTPTPTGSPTATPPPTPTPVPPTAYLDVWDTTFDGNENMVVTWDATTRVRRAHKNGADIQDSSTTPPTTYSAAIAAKTTTINGADTSEGAKRTAYVDRAKLYFEIGDYTNAITDLTNAIGLSDATPNKHQLRNLRGIAHAFKGDYAAAITDFTKVLESNAEGLTSGAAANNRGVVKALQGNYDGPFGSLDDYDTALTHLGDTDDEDITYNNKGNTLRARGKPDSTPNDNTANSDLDLAIAAYGSAIDTVDDVNEARIANNRGLAYRERGNPADTTNTVKSDIDLAIADFTEAITAASANTVEKARFLNNRGRAFMERGDTDSCGVSDDSVDTTQSTHDDIDCAIADFTAAITAASANTVEKARFQNNRGLAYMKRENPDPDTSDNTANSDLDLAIADFTAAITADVASDSEEAHFYNNRGLAHMKRNKTGGGHDCDSTIAGDQSDLDCAIADFTEAIKLGKSDAVGYYNRGSAYATRSESGDQSRAISDFTEAIKRNPADSDFYTKRARAYSANNQSDKSGQDFVFADKITRETVRCTDFVNFDTTYGTSFGSDRAAANAFYQAAMKAGYSQSDLNALMTGGAVCPSL